MLQSYQAKAIFATLAIVALIFLYTLEFDVFSNTMGVKSLLIGSEIIAMAGVCGFLYLKRDRFFPWEKHYPEIIAILLCALFFAPLVGSRINRLVTWPENQSFEFLSESPFIATGYGFMRNESKTPTGYFLKVKKNGQIYRFRTKLHPYFPLSQPGDSVILPLKKGLLGFRYLTLE